MNKKRYVVLTSWVFAASTMLSGCQLLTGYQQIDQTKSATMWAGEVQPRAGEVNITCAGTYHCEIVQIDQTLVIDPESHQPVSAAMLADMSGTNGVNNAKFNKPAAGQAKISMTPLLNQNTVKVVPLSASGMAGLTNYYVRVKPAKREVHVDFYPEDNVGYVERFAIIHEFTEPGTYQLRAYRNKSAQVNGSLLDAASPSPLCIELLQDTSIKRRFCKQLHTEHQGEFVESNVNGKSTIKSKIKPSV